MKRVVVRFTLICVSMIVISLILTGESSAKINIKSVVGFWLFDQQTGDTVKTNYELRVTNYELNWKGI